MGHGGLVDEERLCGKKCFRTYRSLFCLLNLWNGPKEWSDADRCRISNTRPGIRAFPLTYLSDGPKSTEMNGMGSVLLCCNLSRNTNAWRERREPTILEHSITSSWAVTAGKPFPSMIRIVHVCRFWFRKGSSDSAPHPRLLPDEQSCPLGNSSGRRFAFSSPARS